MGDISEKIWYNIAEACEYLGVSRQAVYQLMKDGKLPYYRIDSMKHRRIKKDDLDGLMVKGKPEEADIEESV